MLEETVLRRYARDAIHHGRLPISQPVGTTWLGSGDGEICRVCGDVVNRNQMAVEVRFKHNAEHLIPLHTKCFSAWEHERTEVGREIGTFAGRVVGILRIRQ